MPPALRYNDPLPQRDAAALPHVAPTLIGNAAPAVAACDVTMPHESVSLLCEICSAHGAEPLFRAHSPSLTAAEKDRIVAPARVQKTITIELDGVPLLCTAIGDPVLTRTAFRTMAERLGMPRAAAKRLHVNPRALEPLRCFEMAPGMVSPFLRPGRATPIRAIVLTNAAPCEPVDERHGRTPASSTERDAVAVSLSLRWSLLIAASPFPSILREYAARAYPQVQWIDLRERAMCD